MPELVDGNKLYIEFANNVISDDLTLVEADPFDLMLKTGNKTCRVKYTGPRNAILSESSQCVYALNVNMPSKFGLLVAPSKGCMARTEKTTDSKYFSVAHCERSYPFDEHDFMDVKSYNGEYHVYCQGSNLTVDGHKRKCPGDVFSLPAKTNFAIHDMEFSGSRITIVHNEVQDPLIWQLKRRPKIFKNLTSTFQILGCLLRSRFECRNTFSELSAFEWCASQVSAVIILEDTGAQKIQNGQNHP